MLRPAFLLLVFFGLAGLLHAQTPRTLGLLKSTRESYDGYTLLAPLGSKKTYLVDMCGRAVHMWTSDYTPGNTVRLLPDGSIIRMLSTGKSALGEFGGGAVEIRDWNNNQTWYFEYGNDSVNLHHGLDMLPNGNVLMNVYHRISKSQAIAAGIDTSTVDSVLWSEMVIEVKPTGPTTGDIVWQWSVWDHLVQDYDASKSGYGSIRQSFRRIDVNYPPMKPGSKRIDKWHANSVAYNPKLDQIMISAHTSNEVWIIDHSTTTEQARGSTGGRYGRGGDLLYRFGNPAAYDAGDSTTKFLFGQHDPHWIASGLMNEGKVIVFNNGLGRPGRAMSTVDVYELPTSFDSAYLSTDGTFDTPSLVWQYKRAAMPFFVSPFVSGAQVLPNNNVLICQGVSGRLFEINQTDSVVWEYQNPVQNDTILEQGKHPLNVIVFRSYRYGKEYPAFANKDLSIGYPIEEKATSYECAYGDVSTDVLATNTTPMVAYPNPCTSHIYLNNVPPNSTFSVIDVRGLRHAKGVVTNTPYRIELQDVPSGVYVITANNKRVATVVKTE